MPLKKLALAALVVPRDKTWLPQALGAGSIVEVLVDRDSNARLQLPDEVLVNWIDIAGRVTQGWLARTTSFIPGVVKAKGPTNERTELALSAYDKLRDRFVHDAEVNSPWTVLSWLDRFGSQHVETLTQVIRQLGGLPPKSNATDDIIVRAGKLITQQEVTMEEVKEAGHTATKTPTKRASKKTTGKKTTAKKATAKRAVSAEAPARSMARTVGNTLLPLLEKAGAKRDVVSVAKHLANDESVTKKQLHDLRDAVNELASDARSNNKESLASSLSGANRLVRRLSRKG